MAHERCKICASDKKTIGILEKELAKYKKAYEIMSEYFDSISDEEKPIVNKKLKELNL